MKASRGAAATRLLLWLAAAACLAVPPAAGAQETWSGHPVRVEAAESGAEPYRGRDALRVRNGKVWLDGVDLRDGTVEFDLAVPAEMGYHGLLFRARDAGSYEHVYLRPHLSGRPDATQYTPVFNGVSGWQIYAGSEYNQPLEIPPERWARVRIAFRDRAAEMSVDGRAVVFPRLVRPPTSGSVALTTSGAPARFANLEVRPSSPAAIRGGEVTSGEVPAGTVGRWSVSTPFSEDRLPRGGSLEPSEWEELAWDVLESGERGIANLARLRRPTEERNTVFAALTLRSAEARLLPAALGFSDRVAVYLNGRPLYRGDDGWRTRDYRFLGTIGLFDELVLPLEPGENELWIAVSEDFGGWGVTLRIPETDGVERVDPDGD